MEESKFTDYKGNPQVQFDREPPISVMLPVMDLLTFKANLHKLKPLSIVNYKDKRYSSVIVEERRG